MADHIGHGGVSSHSLLNSVTEFTGHGGVSSHTLIDGGSSIPEFTGHVAISSHSLIGTVPQFLGDAILIKSQRSVAGGGTFIPEILGHAVVSHQSRIEGSSLAPSSPVFTGHASVSSHSLINTVHVFTGSASVASKLKTVVSTGQFQDPEIPQFLGTVVVQSKKALSASGLSENAVVHLGSALIQSKKGLTATGERTNPLYTGAASIAHSSRVDSTGQRILPGPLGSATIVVKPKILTTEGTFSPPTAVFQGDATLLHRSRLGGSGRHEYDRFIYRFAINMIRSDEVTPKLTLYMNDVGIPFQIFVNDLSGQAIDISSAGPFEFVFQRPKVKGKPSDLLVVVPTFLTDGTDGLLTYDLAPDDLDRFGSYRFQLRIGWGDDLKHSEIRKFKVYQNLPIV